jgi:serine/threonine protein kinase
MGQYYLLDKIAQGGMAEIYKGLAYDLHGIRRTVVIKKILPHVAAHREFIDMLVAEAKLAVQLTHGNIAQVYDLGKVGDDYFMVMEYVDGKSVSQIMRKASQMGESIPIPVALHIATEAAAGLYYMHSRTSADGSPLNIMHRDMSPQNLMLTTGGTIKIIDFGIAKAATTIEITDVGVVKGKFAYMSPEQASGDPLDSRTDIFSLAVVLFEMLTGRRLFKGKDNQETLRNVRRANVPRPSMYRSEVLAALDEIVLKALNKSRHDRYDTAGSLRDDLIKFLHLHHSSFHHADVAQYLRQLFQGEENLGRGEESHTPLLIIDRTQSAILASEHDEHEGGAPAASPMQGALPAPIIEEHSEWTPLLTSVQVRQQRQRYLLIAIVAVMAVLASVAVGYWRSHMIITQPVSVTASRQALPGAELPPTPETVTLPSVPVAPPPPPTPPEPYGTVIITSDPPGAEIYWDDQPLGRKTPTTLERLPADQRHTVGLLERGYKFWTVPVTIRAGGVERLNATLERDYAGLEIITVPPGADVFMDAQPVGKTPLHLDRLIPGKVHTIIVRNEGFLEWKTEIKTAAGRHTILRPQLERDPRAIESRQRAPEALTPPPTTLPSVK